MGLEGVIAKRANAPYVSRRTDDWLKLKCKKRQEFVIAGYMDRSGTTRQVGIIRRFKRRSMPALHQRKNGTGSWSRARCLVEILPPAFEREALLASC